MDNVKDHVILEFMLFWKSRTDETALAEGI